MRSISKRRHFHRHDSKLVNDFCVIGMGLFFSVTDLVDSLQKVLKNHLVSVSREYTSLTIGIVYLAHHWNCVLHTKGFPNPMDTFIVLKTHCLHTGPSLSASQ